MSLLTAACGNASDGGSLNSARIFPEADAGVGGAELGTGGTEGNVGGAGGAGSSTAGAGGTDAAQGGSANGGSGSSSQGGSDQGGTDSGTGGTDQGQGGSDVGAGGSDVGQAGTGGSSAGTGGTDQGQGGSEQGGTGGGGTGGTGGTGGDPSPLCDHESRECDGLVYKECELEAFPIESQCDFYCDIDRGGCYGECTDGDVRCADGAAQACVDAAWTVTEQCTFQCVAGACEGACTPGAVVCDGLATVTCGSDFHYGSPSACPTDPNGTTSCNDGECDLQPIACSPGTDDCNGDWSCETDLSSLASCGACGNACPTRTNATRTCDGTCGFTCNAGFEDCDGDPSNGCELDTRADALNCGACGNSCYGSTCTAGECQFGFEVVSDFTGESSSSNVRQLALSATHAYWLTDNELRRAPKAGGAYETLTAISPPSSGAGATAPGLVLEAGKIGWSSIDGVYVMPESGGTPTRIFQTRVFGLAGTNGKLYWSDSTFASTNNCRQNNFSNESAFRACNSSKSSSYYTYDLATDTVEASWTQTHSEHSGVLGVVGSEMFVAEYQPIFVNSHADYSIRIFARNPTTGAILRTVADAITRPSDGIVYGARIQLEGVAFTADAFVYSSFLATGASSFTGVVTGPVTGGAAPRTTNVLVAETLSSSVALDATSAFYSDYSGVKSVSLEGGTPHPFFDNDTDALMQIAVDGTYIYFSAYATNGEQAVLRAPK